MKKNDTTKVRGIVTKALPNTMFEVELEDDRTVLATLKGVLRRKYTRVMPGDKVEVEMTKYDDKRGRIVNKFRK